MSASQERLLESGVWYAYKYVVVVIDNLIQGGTVGLSLVSELKRTVVPCVIWRVPVSLT